MVKTVLTKNPVEMLKMNIEHMIKKLACIIYLWKTEAALTKWHAMWNNWKCSA
ncbi:hypothetical protein T4B_6960 [Trichinella pseudospiralis]|uniref:Uncharacterized protein n=1 Tax=Trichinella pseudospiralis TaxID=6337 RepID=A0A0V1GAX3_TRIPS|nr:hypothetical protein T4B_6960 [Trichinella pseudospiralis]